MAAMHENSRSYNKVHPLRSPNMNGAGFRGVLCSPVSATMEKPSVSPPPVDYDDVFGGPPRFVTSMFTSTGTSADKSVSRVPSFRSSSSPVFELPVFGEGLFSKDSNKSSQYTTKSAPFAYEDIFKEDTQVFDVYPGSTSRESNAKSRPSSRQMSPLHPAAANGLEKDKASIESNAFLQPRSASRNQSSFPSSLSVDEFTGNGFNSPSRNDRSATVVPSSPLPGHSRDHLQQTIASNSSETGPRIGIQFDDVFGGFPQSRLFQQKTALGNNSRDDDVYVGESEKQSAKGIHLRDNVTDVSGKTKTLPNSASPVDEPETHDDFIEIRMDRQNDSRGSGRQDANVAETWVTVNDLRQSSQLKFKSWKDWASDSPTSKLTNRANNSDSPKLRAIEKPLGERDSRNAMTEHGTDSTEGKMSRKNSGRSSLIQQYISKFSTESTEQTAEMEEKELQALLASAWKLNEESEKKQNAIKRSGERPRGPELKAHLKDRRNNHRLQSHKSMKNSEDNEGSKSYLNQENMDTIKSASFDIDAVRSDTTKPPFKGVEVKKTPVMRDTVFQDRSSKTSRGIEADTVANGHRSKESTRSPPVSQMTNESGSVTSGHQDFVHCNEESAISFIEEIEDIECFLDLESSTDGFHEIEGESMERRKSRLERHVRTRERAAKALEEMQQREAELQRQQEQKHQLAETADRKIKHWASGKEGNLRALLSNLQHVLWPDSGWAPIPLSSLIEGSDVKKAYRKATLFIHPDKLQQKSATLQQKYIAERVFDILQEAWKTFNNQELF